MEDVGRSAGKGRSGEDQAEGKNESRGRNVKETDKAGNVMLRSVSARAGARAEQVRVRYWIGSGVSPGRYELWCM